MNIEEAKVNIGAEVVLLQDTKPYCHAEGLSALDKIHPRNKSYSLFLVGITELGEAELSCVPRGEYKIYFVYPEHIALKATLINGTWVSVEDRLPADRQDVLIYSEKTSVTSARYYKADPKIGYHGSWSGWFSDEIFEPNVTHWQPLPSPPIQSGDNV